MKRVKRNSSGSFNNLKRMFLNTSGTTVVSFALALPVLLGMVGVGIDFGTLTMKRGNLQAAGDAAALAGAKELSLASSSDQAITSAAQAFLAEQTRSTGGSVIGDVIIDRNAGSVTVKVTEVWTPFFAHFISADVTPVTTSSTASLAGETKICVLSLAKDVFWGFSMLTKSHIRATGCGIYSNSVHKAGMHLGRGSTIDAAMVCSSGGVENWGGTSTGAVVTDCPPIADPLASRVAPTYGACTYTNMVVSSGNVTLKPGVYCGGLKVENNAMVSLLPGTYVMKNGPFRARDTATIKGKDVGFFMAGLTSLISFTEEATIDLSGAETGVMAGLLFFDDPKQKFPFRMHNISSTNAHTLTGTIYLPNAILLIDPNANVGDKSAYTAIIAEHLAIERGPYLVLNTDYSATSVPVPAGIRSTTSVVLSN